MWWLALSACSFSRFEYTPCEDSSECRDAFGFGSACGAEGYCRDMVPLDRCARSWPDDLLTNPDDYADRIVFGSVYDSAWDGLEEQASQLAITGVNGQGGLDGVEYGIIQCDYNFDDTTDFDNDDEAQAVTTIGRWLDREAGVAAVVGASTSSSTQAMYETTEKAGILMVSPSATSPALTLIDGIDHSDDNPGMLWRTVPSDAAQATAIAGDMMRRGVLRVGVIATSGPYGEGLASAFIEAFGAAGGVAELRTYEENDSAVLGEHIAAVATGDYTEVLYVGSSVGYVAQFLNGAATYPQFTSGGIGIFLTDAARYAQLFTDATGAEVLYPYVRGTSPATAAGPVYESFRAAYASEFGGDSADDSIYTSYAFDAAWLLIYGSAWAQYADGEITGLGIAKGLRQVSEGTLVPIQATNWNPAKADFELGQSIDVVGASGTLDFDPETEETTGAVDIWHIVQDEEWRFAILER